MGNNFVKLYAELQKLDHLPCSKLKMWSPSINPYFNSGILLHVKCPVQNYKKNRFRIDGEIDKKHALQIIVS